MVEIERVAAYLFDWYANGDWWYICPILDDLGIAYDSCEGVINRESFCQHFDLSQIKNIWEEKMRGTCYAEFPESMFV